MIVIQIEYPDEIQMNFLRMNSEQATQTFTYYCKNSIAWYERAYDDNGRAIVLEGANKFQFKTQKWNRKSVIQDGCDVSISYDHGGGGG